MAAEYYLVFGAPALNGPKIIGESNTIDNALEIANFGFETTQTGGSAAGSGAGTGKAVLADFTFEIPMNRASPALMVACAQGAIYTDAHLTCREAGGKQEVYLKVDFKDVLISKYATAGNGEGKPNDQCAFNYTAIKFQYNEQTEKGNTVNGNPQSWNVKTNENKF